MPCEASLLQVTLLLAGLCCNYFAAEMKGGVKVTARSSTFLLCRTQLGTSNVC